jgi:hypothetical protein
MASAQVKNLYVNAARVPRIFEERGGIFRHHVDPLIENGYAEAIEVLRQTEESLTSNLVTKVLIG